MDLEDMLASKVRRKIIRVLWNVGSINLMGLIRKTNSTYNQVVPHLLVLGKEGIISEQRYGRVRMIKLEGENPKTLLLLQALKILSKDTAKTKKKPKVEATEKLSEAEAVCIKDDKYRLASTKSAQNWNHTGNGV